jgi:hypothetical protein
MKIKSVFEKYFQKILASNKRLLHLAVHLLLTSYFFRKPKNYVNNFN